MSRIVFVHLGPARAAHLWSNIAATQIKFPQVDITLIYSDASHLKNIKRLGINSSFYKARDADNDLFIKLSSNFKFRDGFWRYSLERLIALESWHRENEPENPFLHIESDILMLPNFPVNRFLNIEKLTWIKYNDSHDVSAVLSSPNYDYTNWMANRIRQEVQINGHLTDMTVLSKIRNDSPEMIYLLPTASRPDLSVFPGVFDGASIGMWLNGRDPRNHYGLVRRHSPTIDCEDKPELLKYKIKQGDLYISNEIAEYALFNLHIHSKNKIMLSDKYSIPLWIDVQKTRLRIPASTISPSALLRVVIDFKKRHGNSFLTVAINFIKAKFYR